MASTADVKKARKTEMRQLHLTTKDVAIELKTIVACPNLVPLIPEEVADRIGSEVVEGYAKDLSSRTQWTERNAAAMDLALQVVTEKGFPWTNCSNVKFPLVTVAALQFLSRVAILTKGDKLVKMKVVGADPKGEAQASAKRLETHMSYQLTDQDLNWKDDDEKVKFSASLVGCAFKKSYFDPVTQKNISEHVPAANFVVDYWTRDLRKTNRASQLIPMTLNEILEKERGGLFSLMKSLPVSPQQPTQVNLLQTQQDNQQGVTNSADSNIDMFQIIEQHCWYDMDGDGYSEPYVVSVRLDTKQTLRIVPRFLDEGDVHRKNDQMVRKLRAKADQAEDRKLKNTLEKAAIDLEIAKDNFVTLIEPTQYFTKYSFIPSPDGGFYDLGFGALLGPLNESVNSIVNQLIDAGTMSNTAGGFIGRGVKIKAGTNEFQPFEWKPVDSTGDDLRKNIFPLPVREPSAVLFQMLQALITYSEKISGATDIMTGQSPGQNTPAETSRNTIEQGMKVFSGIYARMHRAFTFELRLLYNLNRLYLPNSPQWKTLTEGPTALIAPTDYTPDSFRVSPAADVSVTSEGQRQQKAMLVHQLATSSPGFNVYLATKEVLEAFDVSNIDQLLPDPKGPNAVPPPQNPKMQIEQMKNELAKKQFEFEVQKTMAELQQAALLQAAKIKQLEAQATNLLASAEGVDTGHQIALINAQIGAAKQHEEGIFKMIAAMHKSLEIQQGAQKEGAKHVDSKQADDAIARAASGMGGMGSASGNAVPPQ